MHAEPKGILVVEDDLATRRHFVTTIEQCAAFRLQGEVGTVAEARQLLASRRVDVLLTDLQLPDGHGLDLIRTTRLRHPNTQVLVISVLGDEQSVVSSVRAGASGYILKAGTRDELMQSLSDLVEGGSPLSPSVARFILRQVQGRSSKTSDRPPAVRPSGTPRLTPREVEVLEFLAKGCSPSEIAEYLHISTHTVITHTRTIHRKLEVTSRAAAIYEAASLGIIKLFD